MLNQELKSKFTQHEDKVCLNTNIIKKNSSVFKDLPYQDKDVTTNSLI